MASVVGLIAVRARVRRALVLAVLMGLGGLGVLTGPAYADDAPLQSFAPLASPLMLPAGSWTEAGTLTGATFVEPVGVAVNQVNGAVYVSNIGNGKLYQFNSSGAFETEAEVPGGAPYEVAVDSSSGDVYVAGSASDAVYKFKTTADGKLETAAPEAIGSGELSKPTGVAVDSVGNLYVTSEETGVLAEYSGAGSLIDGSLITGLAHPQGLAIDASGNIYVAQAELPGGTVEYDSSGACVNSCTPLDTVENNRGVVVSESTNHVFVVIQQNDVIAEYSTEGETHPLLQEFGSPSFQLPFQAALDEVSDTMYVADYLANRVDIFNGPAETIEPLLYAKTEPATEVTTKSAKLHAKLELTDSGEGEVEYRFEYAGHAGPTRSVTIGSTHEAEVEEEATGLAAEMTYKYRVVAEYNSKAADGSRVAFTTGALHYGYAFAKSLEEPKGGFSQPTGLGVGPAGEVFVSNEGGSNVVDVYEPGSTPEVVAEFKVEDASTIYQLAADDSGSPSKGDVYVANLGKAPGEGENGSVEKYEYSAGKATLLESITAGGLVEPTAVAVNGVGDVFVADFDKGTEEGGFVNEYGPEGKLIEEHLITRLTEPEGIAVDSAGNLYIAEAPGVYKYNEAGECLPLGKCEAFGGVSTHTTGVAVDSNDRVYVTPEGSEVQVYETDGTPVGGLGVSYANAWGLGFSPSGSALYVAEASPGEKVDEYTQGPTPEAPETGAAEVKGEGAVLHGTLNPHASAKAGWYFAYNANGQCAGGGATSRGAEVEGQALEESAEASGLEPSTTYTYCMVAYNTYGPTYGQAETFTTPAGGPPAIEGESASSVNATEVDLEGVVNADNRLTECHFQYGIASVSEHEIACTPELMKGFGERKVSSTDRNEKGEIVMSITGLAPHTTYTYRIVAINGRGEETTGAEEHFQTALPPEQPTEEAPEPIGATTATLKGVLNPGATGEAGSYEFLYRQSASECQYVPSKTEQQLEKEIQYWLEVEKGKKEGEGYAVSEALEQELIEDRAKVAENKSTAAIAAGGAEREPVVSQVTGLLPNVAYTFCLRAENEAGESVLSSPQTFTTPTAAPEVSDEMVAELGSTSATVSAQIYTGGLETSYRVQYGASGEYGSETPATSITGAPTTIAGKDTVTRTVSVTLAELQPNSKYSFRFVATNGDGSQTGAGAALTTDAATVAALPDKRVIELVTPPENENADVYPPGAEGPESFYSVYPFEAAANGDAVAFVESQTAGGNGSAGNTSAGDEHLAVRGSRGGWTQTNITPAGSEENTHYVGFSAQLSAGVVATRAEAPLMPTSSLRLPKEGPRSYYGDFATDFGETLYRPLFSGTPPHRTDSPEVLPRERGMFGGRAFEGPVYAGADGSFNDLLFEANDQLLNGEGPASLEAELNEVVEKEVEGVDEEYKLVDELKTGFFEAVDAIEELYDNNELYDTREGHLSVVNVLPDGKVAPGATFGGVPDGELDYSHDISEDGSRIFWTQAHTVVNGQLEEPDLVYVRESGTSTVPVSQGPAQLWTASPDGADAFYTEAGKLWRFEVEGQRRVELAGKAGGVVGVLGANESGPDGAYVYFVSTEALPGENRAGQRAVEGQDNLYVYEPDAEAGGSQIAFIAALGGGEARDWAGAMNARVSNITPDGRALTFISSRNLTGERYADEGAEEVYVYDVGDGSLFCASCRPQASGGRFALSTIPVYTPRRISENGNEVFFDSSAPLVTRDVNGLQNAYEWQRDGSGECEEAAGCVYLLSGGIEGEAYMADASASGNDVFFVARQKLVPEDGTEDLVLYDARVNGRQPVASPECTGTGCQGPPASPPSFATPASVTFEGVGNFAPSSVAAKAITSKSKRCGRGRVRRRAKCVKRRLKHRKRRERKDKARRGRHDRRMRHTKGKRATARGAR